MCRVTTSPLQVLICAGAALVGASSVIYADRSGTQAPPQLALTGGGSSGSGVPGSSAVPTGLRRLLLLEPGPSRWRGDGSAAAGTAPDPLLGNVLVVLAQVGWAVLM